MGIIKAGNKSKDIQKYKCTMCGKEYLEKEFPISNGDSYKANNKKITVCKECVKKQYIKYLNQYRDYYKAIYRLCQIYNWYYSDSLVDISKVEDDYSIRKISIYMSRLSLKQVRDKTFDNTIQEEIENDKKSIEFANQIKEVTDEEETKIIKQKTKKMFGTWYEDWELVYLQEQYDDWTKRLGGSLLKAEEESVKLICLNLLDITKARRDVLPPKTISDLEENYRKNLATAGWQPSANKGDKDNQNMDIGSLIANFEKDSPVINTDPDFEDVDKIGLLISAFFTEPSAIALGIKRVTGTKLGRLLKDRFTVKKDRPDVSDESIEERLNYLFADAYDEMTKEDDIENGD